MGAAIFNLLIGILGVWAGLSGRWVLPGTDSGEALAAVGAAIAAVGVYQLIRSSK